MVTMADNMSLSVWVIVLTFFLSMVLAIINLPDFVPVELGFLRPEWVTLVLIYWLITLPNRVGIIIAWVVGMLMDLLSGSLLGQHAIAFVLVAFVVSRFYQRLRMFRLWQQSIFIFAVVGMNQLINLWIEIFTGTAEWTFWYLLPSLISALVWSWVFQFLNLLWRTFDLN